MHQKEKIRVADRGSNCFGKRGKLPVFGKTKKNPWGFAPTSATYLLRGGTMKGLHEKKDNSSCKGTCLEEGKIGSP